jgi:hypothetical protein
MENIAFMDAVVMALVGFLILYAAKKRRDTWKTPRSELAIQINVWVFASFALGASLMRPEVISAFAVSTQGKYLAGFSVVIGVACANFYFDAEPSPMTRAFIGILYGITALFAFVILLYAASGNPPSPTLPLGTIAFICLLFIAAITLAGLVHGILGPLISAVNIALTLGMLWETKHMPTAEIYFSFFRDLGLESPFYGTVALIGSTLLGMFEYIRNVPALLQNIFGGDTN